MDWAQRTGAGRWALGVGDGAGSVQTLGRVQENRTGSGGHINRV